MLLVVQLAKLDITSTLPNATLRAQAEAIKIQARPVLIASPHVRHAAEQVNSCFLPKVFKILKNIRF